MCTIMITETTAFKNIAQTVFFDIGYELIVNYNAFTLFFSNRSLIC